LRRAALKRIAELERSVSVAPVRIGRRDAV
jgi:hypothetical protein